MWIGKAVLPPANLVGSILQQRIANLSVENHVTANEVLKEIKELRPELFFRSPIHRSENSRLVTFSYASFNISSRQVYGQTGLLTSIVIGNTQGQDYFYLLDWSSKKQRRVTFSSYGAEIIAAADGDDRTNHMKESLRSLGTHWSIPSLFIVDSKALYDTITTLHENRDYRLRKTVQRLRDSFESKQIESIRWVQTHANLADSLTKRNRWMHRLLNRIFTTGYLSLPPHEQVEVHSESWK